MKKIVLFLLVTLMTTVTFAQVAPLNKKGGARVLRSGLKTEKLMDASKLKFAQKNGAKPGKAPRKVGSTTPTVVPDGLETKSYSMMGFSYYSYGEVKHDVEVGFDGNDVYVKGLYTQAPDAWVKGVIEGDKVTFAKDQYVGNIEAFDAYDGSSLGFMDCWLEYSADFEGYTDFVMDYDAEKKVMSDVAGGFLFLAIDDDFNALDAISGTLISPASTDDETTLVTPPASAEITSVDVKYILYSRKKQMTTSGLLALDGNDIYVAGLCPDWASSWVKGTIGEDGIVTFASGQYVGNYSGVYDIYFTSISASQAQVSQAPKLRDAKAVWNAEEKTLIFDEDCWLVENASAASLMYFDIMQNVEVYPGSSDKSLVVPPAGLETRTYDTTVESFADYSYAKGSYPVNIGFDGDDAYMQGLLFFASQAWIKGKRNADGSLTFPRNQYIGTVQGYEVYVVPCDDEENILEDFTFTYDAENDTYLYNKDNTNISFSIEPETTQAVEIIFNVVMKGSDASSGIRSVESSEGSENTDAEVIYDLQGRQIEKMQKGINIVRMNGKSVKVMVK